MKLALAPALAATCALALFGCPPAPPPARPTPDASDAASLGDAPPGACELACRALAKAPCPPLGSAPTCAAFLSSMVDAGSIANAATGKPITCEDIAKVQTRGDALALGFVCQ